MDMTGQDKVSILVTLIVGVAVGAYLYTMGFLQTFAIPEVGTGVEYDGLVITLDSYGACERDASCLTFQVLGDGSYRALYTASGTRVTREGSISRPLRKTFATAFASSALTPQTAPRSGTCLYTPPLSNYRVSISYLESSVILDTCKTDIDPESATWKTIRALVLEIRGDS